MSELHKNPIICVDFDGVIHSYKSGWKGADIIPDDPVPGAIEWLLLHLPCPDALGMGPEYIGPEPVIYSARSSQRGGIEAMKKWLIKHGVDEWYFRDDILKFPKEKPAAFLTLDDRCIKFTGHFPSAEEMMSFRSWQNRDVEGKVQERNLPPAWNYVEDENIDLPNHWGYTKDGITFTQEFPYDEAIAAGVDLPRMSAEEMTTCFEKYVERSVGAMAIAEGDEGWENIPIDCPMLAAVRDLRLLLKSALAVNMAELDKLAADRTKQYRAAYCDQSSKLASWLQWSEQRIPDLSPGDVIAAYSDGTIVLDYGLTTWNPLRALAFLAAGGSVQKERNGDAQKWEGSTLTTGADNILETRCAKPEL